MKLRMTQNSIRIRVRKSELAILSQIARIRETVHFPGGQVLQYCVEIVPENRELEALLEPQLIRFRLPQTLANEWMNTQQVGLSHEAKLANGETLHLLIEKDFPCLDREGENVADTFWELAPDKPEAC